MAEGLELGAETLCIWQPGVGTNEGRCQAQDNYNGGRCGITVTRNILGRSIQVGACSQQFDVGAKLAAASKRVAEAVLDAADEEAVKFTATMDCEFD